MTDFKNILDKAKELEGKDEREPRKNKKIRVEGSSGSNLVK